MSDFLDDLFKEDQSIPFEKRERKEWVEDDPITGGKMTCVTIGKGFYMQIPHQCIKMTPEEIEKYKAFQKEREERNPPPGCEEITYITNRTKL